MFRNNFGDAMATDTTFVPAAEAAFIAGLEDRDINRLVDERIVPASLLRVREGRRYSRLAAAFGTFYFATENALLADCRRKIVLELTRRIEALAERDAVISLTKITTLMDWKVKLSFGLVDVSSFIEEARVRSAQAEQAEVLVRAEPEVMGGVPCFSGTRVPIETVLGSLDAGVPMSELQDAYPFLTDESVQAARIYDKIHPKRGRPRRRLGEANPDWKRKDSRVVRSSRS